MPDFAVSGTPPYAMDDAALHHVFDGGWMWVLRFGNGVTSAGIAVVDSLAKELRLSDGVPAWERFLARYPSIAAQFADAQAVREFTWMPRVAYRASAGAGAGWVMLPSAAGFIDPLFSTGIPLTLLGIERIAAAIDTRGLKPALYDVADVTFAEADHTARFVAGCYAAFPRFEEFTTFSMFYFAAASFSEMQRRLAPDRAAGGFLRTANASYVAAMRELSPAICVTGQDYFDRVARSIDSINIAGLANRARVNWYPVDLEDTVRGAAKLGVTAGYVREQLMPTSSLVSSPAP
jgi:FADH2 O2-dependent halogenase